MSYYATKSDLKHTTDVHTLKFAEKANQDTCWLNASLEPDVDELDIDKLKNVQSGLDSLKIKVDKLVVDKLVSVPTDLTKLSDVVKDEVVQKDVCDKLIKKINVNDTSKLVKKTDYDAKIRDIEGKIPSVSNVATTDVVTVPKKDTKH